MKNMKENSPLVVQTSDKKITNHSARKTCVRKLKAAGHPKCEIKNVTGHSREEGLDPYDSGSDEDLHKMSSALSSSVSTSHQFVKTSSDSNSSGISLQQHSLLSRNFSFDIPWNKSNDSSGISCEKSYVFNNCSNITITEGKAIKRKRLRIMSSSSEDSQ